MKDRKFMDLNAFEARNMQKDGNVDYMYWWGKSIYDRLKGAAIMNAVAFSEPEFIKGKVDRTIYSSKKHL